MGLKARGDRSGNTYGQGNDLPARRNPAGNGIYRTVQG